MKNGKLGRKGTTMVEVLVAFIVVMIMLLMFTKIVMVSANMLLRSQEAINRAETYNANYYKLENQDQFNAVGGSTFSLIRTDAEGQSISSAPVELDKIILQKFEDGESGLMRYRFAHKE